MSQAKLSTSFPQIKPSYEPVGSRSVPLGSTASFRVQSNCRQHEMQALMRLAKRVLADANAVQVMGDRVYQLMQEEARYANDHRMAYRSRF